MEDQFRQNDMPAEGRLRRLEGRLRRLERLSRAAISTCLALAACCAFIRTAAPGATQSRATSARIPFTVVDEKGQRVLWVDRGVMRLYDETGRPIIELSANRRGGSVTVRDPAGQAAARLSSETVGGGLALSGGGKPIAWLTSMASGARFILFDSAGKVFLQRDPPVASNGFHHP